MTDKNESVGVGFDTFESLVRPPASEQEDEECEEEEEEEEQEEEEEEEWKGEALDGVFESFEDDLKKRGFIYAGEGSFRRVYERKGIVIKVPTYTDGLLDNRVEHAAYHRYWNGPTPTGVYLAPCRLMANGCLMMKRIDWINYNERPAWSHLIDGRQVGTYKGRAVAYDFALDMTDRFEWERQWKCASQFFNSRSWRGQRDHINSFLTRLEMANAASSSNSEPL